MAFFQAGFEITRLPKGTTMSTPMIADGGSIISANDSTTSIRVGIGSSVFQVGGSICTNRFAMASLLSGIYIVASSGLLYGIVVYSPLAVIYSAPHWHILVLVGTMMASSFALAFVVAVKVLPQPNNEPLDTNGATAVTKPKSV